jgi:hypothetical protein
MARLIPIAALLPLLLAATPDSATYHPDADELLTFLVISDTHVDAPALSGKKSTENLHWATSVLFQTVAPDFMVNSGDLTDATGGGLIPLGPQEMEWSSYREIVDANGMTPDRYVDLPGNHDHYLDGQLLHYLDNSVSGRTDGKTNHAWVREVNGTKYLFVAVASCASDGLPFPEDNVGLDQTDLDFLEETFATHGDADIVTLFSHHPAAYYMEAKAAIYDVLADHGVTAFVHGHTHDHSLTWQQGTLHLEVASLGKSSGENVALVAYDGRGLSVRAFGVDEWPQTLITAPLDGKLGGSHKYDYLVPDSLNAAPVRALALHPDGIAAAEAFVDGQATGEMEVVDDNLWQGHFDATGLDTGPHKLKVVATAADNTTATHEITFYVFHDEVPVQPEPEPEPNPEIEPDVISSPESNWEVVEEDLPGQPDSGAIGEETADGTDGTDGASGPAEPDPQEPGITGYIKSGGDDGCTAGPRPTHAAGLLALLVAGLLALRRRFARR